MRASDTPPAQSTTRWTGCGWQQPNTTEHEYDGSGGRAPVVSDPIYEMCGVVGKGGEGGGNVLFLQHTIYGGKVGQSELF